MTDQYWIRLFGIPSQVSQNDVIEEMTKLNIAPMRVIFAKDHTGNHVGWGWVRLCTLEEKQQLIGQQIISVKDYDLMIVE